MKNLHILPRFDDRWAYLYLEHGTIEVDSSGLVMIDAQGTTRIPMDQVGLLMLGPGTKITHAAIKALSESNTLLAWTGEQGVRCYASATGGTFSSHRLLRQAALYGDPASRRQVARRMYQKRFPAILPPHTPIEQIRGMEGARVRQAYRQLAEAHKVQWAGREYNQGDWNAADPLNRALSTANACLYGICHAAILSAGYSPAIGFVHVGKMLSFVYDIADLYKTEVTVPLSFTTVADSDQEIERRVRHGCRDAFHKARLVERILPDIAEVLDARDDLEERPGELEGVAVSMASGAGQRCLPRQPDRADQGGTVGDGDAPGRDKGGIGDSDLEPPEPPGVQGPGPQSEEEGPR